MNASTDEELHQFLRDNNKIILAKQVKLVDNSECAFEISISNQYIIK